MAARARLYVLSGALLILAAAGVIVYMFLSGATFGASYVADKVSDAFRGMGFDLRFAELNGNPITGVFGRGASISKGEKMLATADDVTMLVDLSSVLSDPKLSTLGFVSLSADLEAILKDLPQVQSGGAPAVKRITLDRASISTRYGVISELDGAVQMGDGYYEIAASGGFDGSRFGATALINMRAEGISLELAKVEWHGCDITAEGDISPNLDLLIYGRDVDLDRFSKYIEQLRTAGVTGTYSFDARVRSDDEFSVTGHLLSSKTTIGDVSIEDLAGDLDLNGREIKLSSFHGKLFGGVVLAEGVAKIKGDYSPEIMISADARGISTKELGRAFKWLGDADAMIDISADLSGPVDSLGGDMILRANKLTLDKYEIDDINATIRLKEMKTVGLSLDAHAYGARVASRGEISIAPNVVLDITANVDALEPEKLTEALPQLKELSIKGSGSASLALSGTVDNYAADINLAFPELSLMDKIELSDLSTELSYTRSGLDVKQLSAKIMGASLSAEGRYIAGATFENGNLAFSGTLDGIGANVLKSAPLSLDRISIETDASVRFAIGGTPKDPTVDLEIAADRLKLMDVIEARKFAAQVKYSGDAAAISNISWGIGGMKAEASGEIKGIRSGEIAYDVFGKFSNFDPSILGSAGLLNEPISGNFSGDFRVAQRAGEAAYQRVYLRDAKLDYDDVLHISDISGSLTHCEGDLVIENLRTALNSGDVRINGSVLGMKECDISLAISSADIGRLSRIFMPEAKGYEGLLSAHLAAKGPIEDITLAGDASVLEVRAFGLFLPEIYFRGITGPLSKINFPEIVARVGRGEITGSGSLSLSGKQNLQISASAKGVDLRSLTFTLDRDVRREIRGALDFNFEGSGWIDSFEGRGSMHIDEFVGMGIKVSDFNAPFWVSDGYVMIEDSLGETYGGALKLQMAKDLHLSNWGGRLEVSGAALEPFLKDVAPDLEGTITGSVDMTLRIGGDSDRTSLLDGGGRVQITDGEISGFAAARSLSKITGGRPIRFSSVVAPFYIDGKTLYLLPGTSASAQKDDPVFRYLTLDGSFGIDDKMIDISFLGNVNLRALNFIIGGLQGIVNAITGASSGELLQNFLGGALTSFSRNEFRDVSFNVKGVIDNIEIDDVLVAEPLTVDNRPEILTQKGDSTKDDDERNFKFTLEFPVGPGVGRKNDAAGQISGQFFEQLLKGMIKK